MSAGGKKSYVPGAAGAVAASLAMVLLMAGAAGARVPPLDAAAGEPATQPAETIRQWVLDLASPEPATRSAARRALLHLSARDLPELRRVVGQGAANLPSQREALYEIVTHLFLTADRPRAIEGQSFMGVELPLVPSDEPGLVFRNRLIGFPAYAALEPGDIVLRIEEAPSLDLNDRDQLAAFRRATPPGLTIHLRVLREGVVTTVPLLLTTAPDWGEDRIETVTANRLERADAYWETQFAGAFKSGTS